MENNKFKSIEDAGPFSKRMMNRVSLKSGIKLRNISSLNAKQSEPFEKIFYGDYYVKKSAELTVKKQEELIMSVLPPGISLAEISKRCKWITHVESPHIRTLHFDGKPVLTLHDPETETVHKEDGSVYLKTTQKYEKH